MVPQSYKTCLYKSRPLTLRYRLFENRYTELVLKLLLFMQKAKRNNSFGFILSAFTLLG